MGPDSDELLWALAGNVVVGIGAGTATLAAFAPTLPGLGEPHPAIRIGVIAMGFALFFAGYVLSQVGTHLDPGQSFFDAVRPSGESSTPEVDSGGSVHLFRGVFVVLGVLGLGAGMRLFAITIETWSSTMGVFTGVVCIGGYICGHIGINGVFL